MLLTQLIYSVVTSSNASMCRLTGKRVGAGAAAEQQVGVVDPAPRRAHPHRRPLHLHRRRALPGLPRRGHRHMDPAGNYFHLLVYAALRRVTLSELISLYLRRNCYECQLVCMGGCGSIP